ncbi:hypothetical protein NLJ89_g4880 [Agrocybe chaxingu]|uniref:Beta-catenin-like protein 1 N-terminal domain-containing protein n=1 Tax=Agrocybe chaxingu TaxID=84603 RepID=A0A9W8K866_9AGAR|nr:hypothetical protein NLJ89_g4880 [Agrocybe chaxingu]
MKVPKLPSGGTKRKLPENPTPEMLKKMKLDSNALPKTSDTVLHPSRKATVEEVVDEEVDLGFAPGGDADYFVEEDDEGRFFGGGLTSEQKEILNIFDQAGTQGTEGEAVDLSITRIRKILLSFERAVNRNQDHRSKYPDDPSKFIDSEADLDSAIKALLPLSQVPSLSFPEFVRSGAVTLLVGLLTHENVDIMIDAVEVIYELTDDDLEVEQEEEGFERGQEALTMLVEKLAKIHDENRGYAAELLSILLQDSPENKGKFTEAGGVDVLLKTLSQYRRKDPIDADETEFMDNLFDSLSKFVEGDYAKIDKLLEIRDAATKRLHLTEIEIQKNKQDPSNSADEEPPEPSLYLQRLDGGLFTLQTVDYILAWLMMEDDGCQGHVLRMLNRKDQSTKDILRTLQIYEEHLGNEIDSTKTMDSSMSQKDILKGLISALSSNTTKQS